MGNVCCCLCFGGCVALDVCVDCVLAYLVVLLRFVLVLVLPLQLRRVG